MPQPLGCARCVFFVRGTTSFGTNTRGKCRRFPPIVYYDVTGKQPSELWPTVNENWWCGEFRARKAELMAKVEARAAAEKAAEAKALPAGDIIEAEVVAVPAASVAEPFAVQAAPGSERPKRLLVNEKVS